MATLKERVHGVKEGLLSGIDLLAVYPYVSLASCSVLLSPLLDEWGPCVCHVIKLPIETRLNFLYVVLKFVLECVICSRIVDFHLKHMYTLYEITPLRTFNFGKIANKVFKCV